MEDGGGKGIYVNCGGCRREGGRGGREPCLTQVGLPCGVEGWARVSGCVVALLQYKSTPGKKVSIVGWMVQLPDDPEHPDIFQLNNPDKGRQQARAGACSCSLPVFSPAQCAF